jgi:hypothetical protein
MPNSSRNSKSYIEITADEYIAQGMALNEARRAARLKPGNLTRIREEVYQNEHRDVFGRRDAGSPPRSECRV